jgi:sterol desaturase/sphingolipid hydroxylase (fatty acid hydroxylase superfamily)
VYQNNQTQQLFPDSIASSISQKEEREGLRATWSTCHPMLCELSAWLGLGSPGTGLLSIVATWLSLSILGAVAIVLASATVFYYYYWPSNITFEKWQLKSNPKYPSAEKVRDECVQTLKGIFFATICPMLAIVLAGKQDGAESSGLLSPLFGISKAYCGAPPASAVAPENAMAYTVATFFITWIASDFFEFFYHRLGHKYRAFWEVHKAHHVFFNPSPFAVIADEFVDQFVRSTPLLVYPLLFPVNIDMLFAQVQDLPPSSLRAFFCWCAAYLCVRARVR